MNCGKKKTKVHFLRFKVQKSGRGEGRKEKKNEEERMWKADGGRRKRVQ